MKSAKPIGFFAIVSFLIMFAIMPAFAANGNPVEIFNGMIDAVNRVCEDDGLLVRYFVQNDPMEDAVEVVYGAKGDVYYIKSEGGETYYDLRREDGYDVYSYDSAGKSWSCETFDYKMYDYSQWIDGDDYDECSEDYDEIEIDDVRTGRLEFFGVDAGNIKRMVKSSLSNALKRGIEPFFYFAHIFDDIQAKQSKVDFLGRHCNAYSLSHTSSRTEEMRCETIVDLQTGICLRMRFESAALGGSENIGLECKEVRTPYVPELPAVVGVVGN